MAIDPRTGVDPLAERRREAAEAEARAAEERLRGDPTVGAVGPGMASAGVREPGYRQPVVSDAGRDPQRTTPLHEPLSGTGRDDRDDIRYAERRGSPGYGESRDPDQLQDEIEILQNRMAQRLNGITSAFEPQNLIASVTGEKNPDIFTTIDTILDTARRNPVGSGLIGAGLAALFFGSRTTERPVRPAQPYERPAPGVEGVDADGRRFAASGVADPSSLDRVEENVKLLQDATAARLEAATTAARETFQDTRNRISTGTSYVADTGRETVAWVRENPMAIGLAALAAGALAAGYYTASSPRQRPVPRSRALTVRDEYRDEHAERSASYGGYRGDPMAPSMPPSMGAGTGLGTGTGGANAGGVVGGSGQIVTPGEVRDTVPATPRGGVQAVGGVTSSTSRSGTTPGPTGGSSPSASSPSASSTTAGPSAGSTPPSGSAAGEVARDPKRVPSGAGFGSTAASRGEVESKPSDGHAPDAEEKAPSSTSASSSSASSASTQPARSTGKGKASTDAKLDAMKGAGDTEASTTMTTPRTDADRRKADASSSTDDLTSIYKGS